MKCRNLSVCLTERFCLSNFETRMTRSEFHFRFPSQHLQSRHRGKDSWRPCMTCSVAKQSYACKLCMLECLDSISFLQIPLCYCVTKSFGFSQWHFDVFASQRHQNWTSNCIVNLESLTIYSSDALFEFPEVTWGTFGHNRWGGTSRCLWHDHKITDVQLLVRYTTLNTLKT